MRRRFCDPQDIRTGGIPCTGEGRWQVAFWLITCLFDTVLWHPARLAAHLGQLQADNCPEYLAKCLQSALEQRHFYDQYTLRLETHVEEAQALLEVFDKVRDGDARASSTLT